MTRIHDVGPSLLVAIVLLSAGCGGAPDGGAPDPGGAATSSSGASRVESTTGACDDGTEATCDRVIPECPLGAVLAVQDHCWRCVDPRTCAVAPANPGCDDGTQVLCDAVPPECGREEILAAQDHCWRCVDPLTCAAQP